MSTFIPIFPLGLVVFPGEELHLHIFEPRYKQLMQDCLATGKPFGIPAVLDKTVAEMGTLVRLREVFKVYENGEMDIITDGLEVFQLQGPIELAPQKLYSGSLVEFPENDRQPEPGLLAEILRAIEQLHASLKLTKPFPKKGTATLSYDLAHHAALPLSEEYRLLELLNERERLVFLQEHLAKVLPVALELEKLQARVKLNGDFKMT